MSEERKVDVLLPCPFCGVVPEPRGQDFLHPWDNLQCFIGDLVIIGEQRYIDRWNTRAGRLPEKTP